MAKSKTKPVRETVIFLGVKYHRYPESKHRTDRVYFTAAKRRLHEAIWEHHHGEIPDGMHVHHKDENPLNNAIENLELVTPKEHCSRHPMSQERYEKLLDHLEEIQPLAADWHASPEGKAWHSENAKSAWENRKPQRKKCEHCGNEYDDKSHRVDARFCSNKCKANARYHSGKDAITVQCKLCGQDFQKNRYFKTVYCSRSCSNKARYAKKG